MSGKIAVFFSVAFLGISASFAAVDFTGIKALAGRVSPELASKVEFQELDAAGDEARLSAQDGKILIRATNPRSASLALGRYIRDIAKGHISWCASRIPTEWPLPQSEITVKPLHPYAIAYNYCTISYTMAFWGQTEWQKEIDRLALQGYNIALMTAGLQKVWDLTLTDMGYSEEQRKNYIADDAASAWWHMGNLQGLGGPVSAEQIERDAALGKWMVGAMREVGIEPVFQGFVGLIPSSTSNDQLADSRIFRTGSWVAGFKNPDILDPTCGAFKTFSEKWYANIKKVYALDDEADYPKFLGGDLFHESSPPSSMSAEDQRLCAVNAQSYQQAAFPGVIWILQSWQGSPVQNLRNGLDPKYTLIQALDQGMHNTGSSSASYINNTTGEYLPWVWVEVMNFGGNTGMHGAFRRFRNIGNIPGSGTGSADSFKGYGLLSEGLETNPSSYDMFADAFTKPDGASQNISDVNLPKWLEDYRLRRYGYTDDNLALAHHICSTSVWDCARNQQGTIESVFCANPSYNVTCVSKWGPTTGTPYPRQVLISAARLYLASAKAKPELLDIEPFRYDFVEIFQQILADKAREMLPQCATSSKLRADFMKFIDLADQILACSDEWRLDKKEARVKTKAPDTGVAAYRRMITTWSLGANGTSVLSEYAHRSYAGLMKHYYAERWQAFFDIADGVKTQAEYNSFVSTLNRTFPTATLEATSVDCDPVAVAEAILNALEPPVLKWTDAAQDNLWEGANWVDVNGDTVSWSDNNDVVLSGVGETIAADENVQVGNIELETSFRSASYSYGGESGAYITEKTDLGWSGVTLGDLADAEYRGTFAGAWMGGAKLECAGYHVKRVDDGVTLQMQVRHNSEGDYVKVVSLKLFIEEDGKVYGQYQWANNGNSNTLGTEFTQLMTPANGNPDGYQNEVPKYGIIGLRMYKASSVTVTGALTVNGEVRLKRGETLSLPDITRLADLEVVDGAASLVLGDNQNLTVNNLTFSNGGKLVVKGLSSTLTGATGGESISFISQSGDVPEISPGSLVYVCTTQGDENYGKEQELVIGSNGVAKRKLDEMTSEGFITKDFVSLGWRDLTIDDLSKMEFTGTMTGGWMGNKDDSGNVVSYRHVPVRGCRIERTGDEFTVWMQCVDDGFLKGLPVTLKIENGVVYMKGADCRNKSKGVFGEDISKGNVADLATSETAKGYGVYGFTAKPAAARVADTVANYASLDEAITAAKETTKELSVINDVKYSTARGLTGGIKLTIEEGVMLSNSVNDGTDWGGTCEIIVKGILNIGNHRWTFSNNNILTLYTGGVVRGTGDGTNNGCAVEIHGSEHTVKVYKGAGEVAELNCAVGLSSSVIFDVEEGAALKLGATNGGNQDSDARTIKKIGKGELEFIGTIYQNATVVTGDDASGTIKKSLSPLEVFKIQKGEGEVEIIVSSSDEDYKIVESVEGNLTLYTSVKCDWVANVTDVEDAREDSHGTKYESLDEAIAALATTPNGRIWLIGEYKSSIQAPEGWVKEDSPYGTELWKVAARLNDTNYRTLEGAFEAYNVGDKLVIVDTSAPMPKSWRLINDRPFKLVYWKEGNFIPGVNVYEDEATDSTVEYDPSVHMVVFTGNVAIYPSASSTTPVYLMVEDGVILQVGHDGRGDNFNLPSNSYVELGKDAKLEFIYWGNNAIQGTAKIDSLTVDGAGTIGYDASKTHPPEIGTLRGTATLVIEDGETVKAGSVENPVELRGTGKLLLTSEQSAEAVKFSLDVPEVEGLTKETYMSYFKNKVVKNDDNTYSATSVLNGDVVTPQIGVDNADDTSDDAFKINSDGGISITITNPKPGLYYGVKAMNSLPANGVSEGEIVWEESHNTQGSAKTLTINKSDFKTISFDSPSVFFRIVVDFGK